MIASFNSPAVASQPNCLVRVPLWYFDLKSRTEIKLPMASNDVPGAKLNMIFVPPGCALKGRNIHIERTESEEDQEKKDKYQRKLSFI